MNFVSIGIPDNGNTNTATSLGKELDPFSLLYHVRFGLHQIEVNGWKGNKFLK